LVQFGPNRSQTRPCDLIGPALAGPDEAAFFQLQENVLLAGRHGPAVSGYAIDIGDLFAAILFDEDHAALGKRVQDALLDLGNVHGFVPDLLVAANNQPVARRFAGCDAVDGTWSNADSRSDFF
jgi:hypothetical protein